MFIVADMQPFLTEAAFRPQKLDSLAELSRLHPGDFYGVIISNAVVSPINASAEEVFAAVRRRMPRVPVIFAGLTEFAIAKGAVERVAKTLHAVVQVLPVSRETLDHPDLGRESSFVVLTKDDLSSEASRAMAKKVVQRHFR
jgi:hypothetical protein